MPLLLHVHHAARAQAQDMTGPLLYAFNCLGAPPHCTPTALLYSPVLKMQSKALLSIKMLKVCPNIYIEIQYKKYIS
jgi:hypothetical protein